jgi:predicted kinase
VNQLNQRPAPAIRFIEFMGLPGSGKSTIAAHLESDLKQQGFKTVSRSAELADNYPFVWRHCRRLLRVVRNAGRCRRLYLDTFKLITDSGQKSHWDRAKVTWNLWSVIALMTDCRAAVDSVTIIDQGLFQAIWSIQLSSSKELSAAVWTELLSAAGIADVLVVNVQSEIPIVSNRLVARASKRARLDRQAHDVHADAWQIAAGNMAALINLAQAALPCDQLGDRVITIENDTTCPQAAASNIAIAFLARTRPAPPTGFRDLCCNI